MWKWMLNNDYVSTMRSLLVCCSWDHSIPLSSSLYLYLSEWLWLYWLVLWWFVRSVFAKSLRKHLFILFDLFLNDCFLRRSIYVSLLLLLLLLQWVPNLPQTFSIHRKSVDGLVFCFEMITERFFFAVGSHGHMCILNKSLFVCSKMSAQTIVNSFWIKIFYAIFF